MTDVPRFALHVRQVFPTRIIFRLPLVNPIESEDEVVLRQVQGDRVIPPTPLETDVLDLKEMLSLCQRPA
jgi:hypothetical protein